MFDPDTGVISHLTGKAREQYFRRLSNLRNDSKYEWMADPERKAAWMAKLKKRGRNR